MKLHALKCPNCQAPLEIEDGIDIFFCKYCGCKIILEGQSKASINAKVKMKSMEHTERIKDKEHAQERYKMEFKQKDERNTIFIVLGMFAVLGLIIFLVITFGNAGAKKQERELQAIVDEIMVDIENEDFDAAYIKANSLYWDDSWTSEGEDKWDSTRKAIIKQIKEAEKIAEKETVEDDELESNSGFFDWLKNSKK